MTCRSPIPAWRGPSQGGRRGRQPNGRDASFRELAAHPAAVAGPSMPGMDASGTIDAVGPGSDLIHGDAVMALVNPFRAAGGAQAEYIVVPVDHVAPCPKGWSYAQSPRCR
ncbi:alcohol dehydrogenase catalytic domain-containing protein [Streptomyces sp. NPDC017056]|uniref:alcohol dehydrogenase catalytic domain-containing protein n=1 Tax=Streptomyces sp. NPDC017056 TaxID=3364973 RepID=UPI003790CC22